MGVRAALFAFFGLPLGCNLVVSLDELQDGSGGFSASTASGPNGPNTGTSSSPTGSTGTMGTASTGQGGSGGGVGAYEGCVLAGSPVLYLQLADASMDADPNLGSWGGEAIWSNATARPGLTVGGDDGAASFEGGGSLTFDAPPFFGDYQAFTLELWFTVPADYGQAVAALGTIDTGFELRLEERFDPMGLDSARFRYRQGGTMERLVTEYADWASSPGPHHLAFVYRQTAGTTFVNGEADDLVLYVDGVPGSNPGAGSPIPMPTLMGQLRFGEGFAGTLDEIAVYPAELPENVIAAHAQLGMGADIPCPPP